MDRAMKAAPHFSVLQQEIGSFFENSNISYFVDGTLGAGGHAYQLLCQHPEIQAYIGIDQDRDALIIAKERLAVFGKKVQFLHGSFATLPDWLQSRNILHIQGALFDLGVSSMQLDRAQKGFSFLKEGPLDMRMDQSNPLTAQIIVNQWSEKELGHIFRTYGEETRWRTAASAIVEERRKKPFTTTLQLAEFLDRLWPQRRARHPATLIFQALRIAVNDELGVIEKTLPQMLPFLSVGGKMAVISFHSLEDRIVKQTFKAATYCHKRDKIVAKFRNACKKPVVASAQEVRINPRSRSAKLRVIERIQP